MHRSAALLSLTALLFCASPALAAWPARYVVDGTDGPRGTLELREAGETLIRGRTRFAVELTVRLPEGDLRLTGEVKLVDDMLRGTLRQPRGLSGHVGWRRARRAWRVRLGQGLRNTIVLRQGSTTHTLTGRAEVGPRNAANEALIRRFYEAFQRKDAATMASVYAPDVHFSDRVFPNLHGAEVGAMWAMLCENEELSLTFSGIEAGDRYGVARWEARYSLFGNQIHNVIQASFELADGAIVRHVDQFDFDRWVKQALPTPRRFLPEAALRSGIRLGVKLQLARFRRANSGA